MFRTAVKVGSLATEVEGKTDAAEDTYLDFYSLVQGPYEVFKEHCIMQFPQSNQYNIILKPSIPDQRASLSIISIYVVKNLNSLSWVWWHDYNKLCPVLQNWTLHVFCFFFSCTVKLFNTHTHTPYNHFSTKWENFSQKHRWGFM